MHEHIWSQHTVGTDGSRTRRCPCGEVQVAQVPEGLPYPPASIMPVTIHNPAPRSAKREVNKAAEAARLFTDSLQGSVSAMGALRESVKRVNPGDMFSVYYPPEVSAEPGGVSETLKAEITPEEALQVILNDITADMLIGPEAVRERAARWVTELTTKAARIVKISEGEEDGR
jgi:hypothetical protein